MRPPTGSIPNSAADGAAIISGGPNDGYSNLEVYINSLVGGTPPVIDPDPPGPTLGEVSVCLDSHTFPTSQPTTATCDASFGQPKAAIAFGSSVVPSGATGNGVGFAMGAYDGTSQWALGVAGEDTGSTSPSVTAKRFSTDEMMQFLLPSGAVNGEYDATEFRQ